jgi:hypothetical protein
MPTPHPRSISACQLSQLLDESEKDGISFVQDPFGRTSQTHVLAYVRIKANKQSPIELAKYHAYGILHSGNSARVRFESRSDSIEFELKQHDNIEIPVGIKYQITSYDEPLIFKLVINKE